MTNHEYPNIEPFAIRHSSFPLTAAENSSGSSDPY